MQKSIMCICAMALLFEAVVGAPYAETTDDFDVLDMTKRVVDILSPASHQLDKRASSLCPVDCFSCFKFIRDLTPDPCVKGCQRRSVVGDASYSYDRKMWRRCAQYLQRPLAR